MLLSTPMSNKKGHEILCPPELWITWKFDQPWQNALETIKFGAEFGMTKDDMETRLLRAEVRLEILAEQLSPKPKPWWKKLLTLGAVRDLLYIVGLPVTVLVAYQAFDKEFLSAQKTRELEQKNLAIDRLDKLQDINAQIYRLQTEGNSNSAFAIIEAKRGLIARLTDTVYTAWQQQPEMLGRYDLNALAEALLVQGRTDNALAVATAVDASQLGPVDKVDQKILNARIQFANGPAFDMEAARQQLRDAVPILDQVEREGQKLLLDEKILLVRLVNEFWRNTECEKLLPMAEALAELNALNSAVSGYEDKLGVGITLQGVAEKCR